MSRTSGGAQFDNEDASLTKCIRNAAPPPVRPWTENMVKDLERELARIQAEIHKLYAAVLQHRQDEQKKLLPYRFLLPPPVHRLPPEILGNIFGILIAAAQEVWLKSEIHPALAVSWTCGRWRDIAVSTPSIWSSIMIPFRNRGEQSYRQLHSLTRLFLDRSQKHPLKLVLDFDYHSCDSDMHDTAPILKTLVQHSEQWHTVKLLGIERDTIAHEVFSPIAGHLPVLTDLTISGADGEDTFDDSDDLCIDLFRDSPALTSISYQPFGPLTPQSPLPWGQIRSIRIKDAYDNEVIRVAPLWTNVEQLAFKRCGSWDRYTRDHFEIPSVTHLSIAVGQEHEADFAFQFLTLRQLSSLEILSVYSGWPVWDRQLLTNFLTRSACMITSLLLKRVPITDKELIQFLQLMPMLKSLQLEEKFDDEPPSDELQSFEKRTLTITRQFLGKLTIENHAKDSTLFLPKLTDIGLTLYDHGLAETALPTALLSRWILNDGGSLKESADCIKSIDIVFVGDNKEPVEILKEKLQSLRDTGVWMSLRVARVPKVVEEDDW